MSGLFRNSLLIGRQLFALRASPILPCQSVKKIDLRSIPTRNFDIQQRSFSKTFYASLGNNNGTVLSSNTDKPDKNNDRITLFSASKGNSRSVKDLKQLETILPQIAEQMRTPKKVTENEKNFPANSSSQMIWMDIVNPSKDEIIQISQTFGLHRLTIEDVMELETREKVENYENYTFVVYGSFDSNSNSDVYLEPVTMYNFVFPQGIISLHSKPQAITKQVEDRMLRLQHRRKITSDWVLYALLDEATDGFNQATKPLNDAIKYFTTNLTQGIKGVEDSRSLLQKFGETHQRILQLRELKGSKSDVIKELIEQHKITDDEETNLHKQRFMDSSMRKEFSLHYSDVQDHLIAFTNTLARLEDALLQSEGHCLTQLNIQMMHASQESNDAISKLTVLSTVILPLNVVTGLWGMNVMVPFQEQGDLIPFYSLVGFMTLIASSGFWAAMRFMRKPKRR